jgi:hypothetical protein
MTTSCASYVKFRDRAPIDEFCLEEALKECPALSEPGKTAFDTAVSWGNSYAVCKLKHEILIHCVQEH